MKILAANATKRKMCAHTYRTLNERSCSTFPFIKAYAEEADELNVPALDYFFFPLVNRQTAKSIEEK